MMFSKVDKKILLILIVVIAAVLLVGFMVYQYMVSPATKMQNSTGGAQTEVQGSPKEDNNNPQVQVEVGGIQAQGGNGQGMLSVCLDKCGDGVCQKTDPNCGKDNNLNCICPETPQDCPEDCK